MQVLWIALVPLVFQVHIADGAVFPVPAALRSDATEKLAYVARENSKRIKKKHQRSTSSSSGEKIAGSASADSLAIDDSSDYNDEEKRHKPGEPQGWRKWHRRCEPCPRDMLLKWRDPEIKWICGGYQRARRTFKSTCMMEYRNCQDGTMFVKMYDNRCNDKAPGYNGGRHFFYDYVVELPDDSSDRETEDSSGGTYTDSDSSD